LGIGTQSFRRSAIGIFIETVYNGQRRMADGALLQPTAAHIDQALGELRLMQRGLVSRESPALPLGQLGFLQLGHAAVPTRARTAPTPIQTRLTTDEKRLSTAKISVGSQDVSVPPR